MNKVIGALPALLLVVTSALPTRAAPLGPSLPSGASDQVIFSGPGSLPNRVDVPEAAGGAEPTAVFDCDSSICIPGAVVALTEPGRPTVVSDLLTVSGGEAAAPLLSPQQLVLPVQIVFRSDSESGPLLVPPAGAVFLPEAGEPQDLSALVLQPAAIGLGFQLIAQSDVETVAAPDLLSAALLLIGAFTVWTLRSRRAYSTRSRRTD